MLSIFVDTLNAANGRELVLGPGTFVIDAANPELPLADYTSIRGSGRGNTIIEFRNLGSSSHGFFATGKTGIRLSRLTIKAATALSANQNAVNFEDCTDCWIEDVEQLNFSGGFWFTDATGPTDTTNLRNKAINCISRNSSSYGFFYSGATGCVWDGCEAYGARSQDGFKTGRNARYTRIVNCHAEGNEQDGFDTFDGFIDSVMSNCTAINNNDSGFQIKGTLGGTFGGDDYTSRDSTVSNCVARGNGFQGFLLQECRSISFTNLVAIENAENGFVFNNTQGCTATGLIALRNTKDGFNLQGNASRNTFNGCVAQDNSYTDGVTQNDTYDGFNLVDADANTFNGCQSFNGTQPGKQGGQRYGYNTEVASVGNTFTACFANANISGDTNP